MNKLFNFNFSFGVFFVGVRERVCSPFSTPEASCLSYIWLWFFLLMPVVLCDCFLVTFNLCIRFKFNFHCSGLNGIQLFIEKHTKVQCRYKLKVSYPARWIISNSMHRWLKWCTTSSSISGMLYLNFRRSNILRGYSILNNLKRSRNNQEHHKLYWLSGIAEKHLYKDAEHTYNTIILCNKPDKMLEIHAHTHKY